VTVAPRVRRKMRIPRKYGTPELRARFARGAADEIRREYVEAHESPVPVACNDAVESELTFEKVANLWTSGELARRHPDHVDLKKTASIDKSRLKVINKLVGGVAMADFTVEHAERVMGSLPARCKTPATRRHHAQLIHRILALACYPMRLLQRNPLPRGFLPKPGKAKAAQWLYPVEDAALLAFTKVPLWRRLLWCRREGIREGGAMSLSWSGLDLERGVVTLDENKTDDARAWALGAAVVRALQAWKKQHLKALPEAKVFGECLEGKPAAELLRADLRGAGVSRAELYARSASRLPVRVHDLRATFVTSALANGKTETWVMDRTGHRSSEMVNRYRRSARRAEELGLGELTPLDTAIPELAARVSSSSGGVSESSGGGGDWTCLAPVSRATSDPVSAGSDGRIRTFVRGIKILCPAIRRRRRVLRSSPSYRSHARTPSRHDVVVGAVRGCVT
jgi:integrase